MPVCATISRVLLTLVLFALCVCMCVCVCMYVYVRAYIFIYIYVCIMHKRTSRYNSSGREKWVVFHRYWPSVHHDSHQKTRIPLFLPRITPIPIYFHPIYFHSLRPHPRPYLYPIRVLSSRNILMLETRFRLLVPLPPPLFLFLHPVSIALARIERLLRLVKVYDLYLLSFLFFFLSFVRTFFLPFSHSLFLFLSFIYSLLRLSELRNPTKCSNC